MRSVKGRKEKEGCINSERRGRYKKGRRKKGMK